MRRGLRQDGKPTEQCSTDRLDTYKPPDLSQALEGPATAVAKRQEAKTGLEAFQA